MKLLIIDDEVALAETIAKGLRRHGHTVDVAFDGTAGLAKAIDGAYDVIILDRDLPGVHGDDICVQLVSQSNESNTDGATATSARILMLTASSDNEDLVEGLGLGADDYLGKPFDFSVLVARIAALGRRPSTKVSTELRFSDLRIDTGRHSASRAGATISLTAREFEVLRIIAEANGRCVSAEELFERAWDDKSDPFTQSVRVIVSRLRSKLGDPPLITTVVGRGYKMDSEASPT